MASHATEFAEFVATLDRELSPAKGECLGTHVVAELASKLVRAAGSLRRRYEAACSYEWACTEAYEAATTRKEENVAKLLKPYGITAEFCDDPRGAPIKLKLPSGRSNAWGGEGYCVPVKS